METPWGPAQHQTTIAPGIITLDTAGHGGIHLDEHRNAQMPAYMRADTYTKRGWYEEDCDWAKVAVVFAAEWSVYARRMGTDPASAADSAMETFRDWYPNEYELFTGKRLQPGESYKRDCALFRAATRDRFVTTSAVGDWHKDVTRGKCGVWAKRERDGATGQWLVDHTRYTERRPRSQSYVIDETVDIPWTP